FCHSPDCPLLLISHHSLSRLLSTATAAAQLYTLSLHDALPIYHPSDLVCCWDDDWRPQWRVDLLPTYKAHRVEAERETAPDVERSEEHTSELQSRENLVCRLLLEKKK